MTISKWHHVIKIWDEAKPLIRQGYRILDKEVTMGMPGPCMPADSTHTDIGIGSPYGAGADRVWRFFDSVADKILLGPAGRTHAQCEHSPYVSDIHPNPFFIPVEKLVELKFVTPKTLEKCYRSTTNSNQIDFAQVEANFNLILHQAYQRSRSKKSYIRWVDDLAQSFVQQTKYPYINDLQVQVPYEIVKKHPRAFLTGFTLGTPADILNPEPCNWGFAVFDPQHLWRKDGHLGVGGLLWQEILRQAIQGARGGLRIDHFISFINPYVISKDPQIPNGRLYSSLEHPVLKKYALNDLDDFGKIIRDILLPVMQESGLSTENLYPEDIGSRPKQMDSVMQKFGLGRLLVAEFKKPDKPYHIYQLMHAHRHDIATLDTHDTPSIQMFFDGLGDAERYLHAQSLVHSLRFHYNDTLKSTEQLVRMQWAELLACPAKRVQAFFTSWIGQVGRYNHPDTHGNWVLRCDSHFEQLYFKNLMMGRAYNPLDAIALAVYARGDDFYHQHRDFVAQLHIVEDELKASIKKWLD